MLEIGERSPGSLANHQAVNYAATSEWLERGDYFNFIRNAEFEMKNRVSELGECFSEVKVVTVDVRAAWYICTPE